MPYIIKGIFRDRNSGKTETDVELLWRSPTPVSFTRMFGPDTATSLPANTWVSLPLEPDAIQPVLEVGDKCWVPVNQGDPDYSSHPNGIRCLRDGIYSFSAAAIFDNNQGTGDRGIRIVEVKGPNVGLPGLVVSQIMPKFSDAGLLVSGDAYEYIDSIVELQVRSTVNTSTTATPKSEWLCVTLVNCR